MQTVRIDLQSNRVTITPVPGTAVDLTSIPKAIERTGFVPGDMYIVAQGRVIVDNGSPRFRIKHWNRPFPIDGPAPGDGWITFTATVQFQKNPPVLSKRSQDGSSTKNGNENVQTGELEEKQTIPKFSITTLDGKTISGEALEGQVVLVNFWGTWCPPCVREAPHLQQMYEKWKEEGLVILGLAVSDTEKSVKNFREEEGLTYPMAVKTKSVQKTFKQAVGEFGGIPTIYLFDRRGQLKHAWTGYQKPGLLKSAISGLIEGQTDEDSTDKPSDPTPEAGKKPAEKEAVTATFKVVNLVEREDKL